MAEKMTDFEREHFESSLNKLDWLSKLAAANLQFARDGARLKTDGVDPHAEIALSNKFMRFLVAAGRSVLAGGSHE